MVLTRRQEQILKQQYRVSEIDGKAPDTPQTPREITLPDGRRIKSALKVHTGLRPWEDPSPHRNDDREEPTPDGQEEKKKVRISSAGNVVHVFEGSQMTGSIEQGGGCSNGEAMDGAYEEEESKNIRMSLAFARSKKKKKAGNELNNGNFLLSVGALLLWGISSSGLVLYMRDALREKGLPLPFMLPAISQLGSAVMVWVAAFLGLVHVRPVPPRSVVLRSLLPMAASTALCLSLGNFAFFGLSVAFLSILKAMVPAVTFLLSVLAGMESLSGSALSSTLLIAYGTGVATVQETSHNTNFDWLAFASFTASVFFEASRVVFVAQLMADMDPPYNAFEVMAHVGPLVFVLMACCSILLEWNALLHLGLRGAIQALPVIFNICLMSLLVNVSSYLAIKCTSSTTFKVAGCFKNAATLWLGTFRGDVVTVREVQGFVISTVGFLWYIWVRSQRASSSLTSSSARKRIKNA